jgi:hypothetical protein
LVPNRIQPLSSSKFRTVSLGSQLLQNQTASVGGIG